MLPLKTILIIIIFCVELNCSGRSDHRQGSGKVDYYNPKYIGKAIAFTGRINRNRPYMTNATVTILYNIGNNVTGRIQHNMKNSPIDLEIVRKACEFSNIKWIFDFMHKYTDLDITKCPIPPGTYSMYNMQFEADKILLPIPKGINELTFVAEKTDTRELILKLSMVLERF